MNQKPTQRRTVHPFAITLLMLCTGVSAAAAQTRPFLYTLTPTTGKTLRSGAYSDLAYGRDVFGALGPEKLEQRVSVQLPFTGRLMFAAQVGWAVNDASTTHDATIQGEILANLAHAGSHVVLGAGVGAMQDYSGTPIALGRLVAGYRWTRTLAVANVRLEHAYPEHGDMLEEKRDAVDLVSTFGVSHALNDHVHVGIESVAEDLEGFVEDDEAEGGAKLMIGPSLAFSPRAEHWNVHVTAGSVFHLTQSTVSGLHSAAPRELTGTGYILRASFGAQW